MASGGIYTETLELPDVPEAIVNGSTFVKWEDDSAAIQPCTVKIDSSGNILYWKYEDKAETDLLDVVQIRDVRTGKYARIPKDSKVKELIKARLPSCDAFEDHFITVVYGPNMVDTYFINFVALVTEDAKLWSDCLMSFCEHVLVANASPLAFLKKHYTKLVVQVNPDGEIPVKLITKYIATNKDDKRKVYETLQSLGLPCKKEDSIKLEDLTLDAFLLFMSRLCNRKDIDTIFAEIGAKKKPYLTVAQFVDFLNSSQRDPRLNEILFPYYNGERAQHLIDLYEPNTQFAEKGQLSVHGFTRYLMSEHNNVVNSDRFALHQDMNAPLSHYFINSSHNTYLTGHQLTGKSSVEIYRQVLMSGCRCIELDCWDGKTEEQEPVITHGMTLCTEVLFKDVIEAVFESSFKTSDYPVILSFENHCSKLQQRKMAQYCVSIFGDMLLDKPIDDFPLDDGKPLPSPKSLLRKIIIKNKKKQVKAPNVDNANGSIVPSADGIIPVPSDVATTNGDISSSEVQLDEASESLKGTDGESLKDIMEKTNNKKEVEQPEEEVESENVLSDLVNYIQPVHFKGFEVSESRNKSFEMTSFVETVATTLLKQEPVEFVNYNKRQLSRIYPKGTRVGSENYMPQIFWNAGCQLVALNFQTLDVPMMLNLGKFEYNGKCGYIRKPDFMCRTDRSFDPFAESTVDGIIAGSVEVKVLSGQFLSDRKVGTYVEVDMYGLPADTVRRKYRTKTVSNSGVNSVYDEEPFNFQKVVLPSLAVLRLAVYEESGKLIGHRVLPVDSIQPGYRHIKLKNDCYQALCLPVLFVHFVTTDYVPSTFSEFADALTNPIAFQSKDELRSHMLETLMDDDEATSQVPEMQPIARLGPPALAANIRRASAQLPSLPSSPGVKLSTSVGNLNGMQTNSRSVSLTVDHVQMVENTSKTFKRSQSTKARTDEPEIAPIPINELRNHKNIQKIKVKHSKEIGIVVKKHERDKSKMQKQHFMMQEKLAKEMEKDVELTKRKLDKSLKKASKSGVYEDVYREGLREVSSLRKDQEMKMNVLKLEQREEVITLIEGQLKEQHELAKDNIDPEFEELQIVMDLSKNEQSRKLAEHHERIMNGLKRRQDAYNRNELKILSSEKKSKEEIQRLKREQNKRHIEQSVKERQKVSEFNQKEMQQLVDGHENLETQLEKVKEKSVQELLELFEIRCKNIRNADLETIFASLFSVTEEESRL